MVELGTVGGAATWWMSRALGVTAYVALTLEVLLGLGASTGALDRWGRPRVLELHRWLAATTLGAIAGHALLLLLDRAVPFSLVEVVVPFASAYRPVAVGLGTLGAWLVVLVQVSHVARRRLGPKTWRALHYLTFGVWALVTIHGLAAGTDAGRLPLRALYVASTGLVAWLTLLRVGLAVLRARGIRAG